MQRQYLTPIPFLVSGWSTLTEDLRKGGDQSADVCQELLDPPLSVSVDHPLTRKGIESIWPSLRKISAH